MISGVGLIKTVERGVLFIIDQFCIYLIMLNNISVSVVHLKTIILFTPERQPFPMTGSYWPFKSMYPT